MTTASDIAVMAQVDRLGLYYRNAVSNLTVSTGVTLWETAEESDNATLMNYMINTSIAAVDTTMTGGTPTGIASGISAYVSALNNYVRALGYSTISAYLAAVKFRVSERFAEIWSAAGGTTITRANIAGDSVKTENRICTANITDVTAGTFDGAFPSTVAVATPVYVEVVTTNISGGTSTCLIDVAYRFCDSSASTDGLSMTTTDDATAGDAVNVPVTATTGFLAGDLARITGTISGTVTSEEFAVASVDSGVKLVASEAIASIYPSGSVIRIVGRLVEDFEIASGDFTVADSTAFLESDLNGATAVDSKTIVLAATAGFCPGQTIVITGEDAADNIISETFTVASITDGTDLLVTEFPTYVFDHTDAASVVRGCVAEIVSLAEGTGFDVTAGQFMFRPVDDRTLAY